jgi:hypothetical protein
MKLTGEDRSTRGKTCPSATLSITNPTWTDPGSNPGLRGVRLATNRLSHGTVFVCITFNKHSTSRPANGAPSQSLMQRHRGGGKLNI